MTSQLTERLGTSTSRAPRTTRLARSLGRLTTAGGVVALLSASASSCGQGEPSRTRTEAGENNLGSVQQLATLPDGFQENVVIMGRTSPVALRFAPKATQGALTAFLAEKSGRLFAYQNIETQTNPTQVIDLSQAVHDYWDRGLLGLAIHPNYPETSRVFVLYAHDSFDGQSPRWGDTCPNPPGGTEDGCPVYGRLSRIDIDKTTLMGTETPLIETNWCQQYPSHSIGDMHFGADGYLYVTGGEGASFTFNDVGQDGTPVNPCGDPGPVSSTTTAEGGRLRSQDVLSNADHTGYGGSLLRLDVSGATVTAPPDNPLVGKGTTADDFIVATGLRNPFRFTVRPGTNELWIADVGQDAYEELNRVQDPKGSVENFGFPCYEGTTRQSYLQNNVLCTQVNANTYPAHVSPMHRVEPYYAYHHSANVVAGDGCPTGTSSITGVAFNNHAVYPSQYAGALFFADSSRRCVWAMFPGSDGLPNPQNRGAFISGTSGRVVDIQMGPDGRLYYVDFDGGLVYRIDSFVGNEPPQASVAAAPTSGAAPLSVEFDASASTDDEDSGSLTYAWDFDDDGAFDDGSGVSPSFVFHQSGSHLVHVQATDSGGLSSVASLTITVDNTPPTVTIDTPADTLNWAVGDTITFSGHGTDAEQGTLPPERLSWQVILNHCSTPEDCHAHPIQSFEGVASGSFKAPDHDYPSYLELVLSATDNSAGWYHPAWQFRRSLTLDHSGLSAVDNVPVLVQLDSTRINYAATQPGGRDLRFVDATGTVLAHEVELWNPNGTSVVWVKVPSVAAFSTDQQILMYYGNPAAEFAESAEGVWSNGYVAVWHMDTLSDSTSFNHDGTNQGTTVSPGRIGNGRSFNGQSYATVASSAALQISGSVSIEAWAKPSSATLAGYPRIVSKKSVWDAAAGYDLEISPSQNFFTAVGGGANYLRANTSIGNTFNYYASSISGTSGSLYKNGVNVTSDTSVGAVTASTQVLEIGRNPGATDYMNGQVDELRISNVARNANWFAVQYRSMTDAYLDFGSEERSSTLGATTSIVLEPATADVTFESDPPGIQVQVGNDLLTTPTAAETAIQNSRLSVSVVSPQVVAGTEYEFVGWSNGGDQSQLYTVDGDKTLSVTFAPVATVIDADDDGLPDDWETEYGLDPEDASDATLDGDEDRLSNLQEFGSGTDPSDPDSDGDSWDDFTEVTFDGDPLDPEVLPNPPIVNIRAPESGAVVEGSVVQVDFTTSGIILLGDHVHLELDGGTHVTVSGTSGSYTFTGVTPGGHRIEAQLSSAAHQPYAHEGASTSVVFDVASSPKCGNGIVEANETCDTGGATANCDSDCTAVQCGDGTLNVPAGEQCDTSGQSASCDANCTPATCGDGTTNSAANEQCDDGNTINADGCSNTCVLPTCTDNVQNGNETGKDCGGSCPACPSGSTMVATVAVNDNWGGGYCATLNIRNNGTKVTKTWSAILNMNGTTLSNSWNGNFSAKTGSVTVTPISWNSAIQPATTNTSIGFCATRPSGSAVATAVSATGTY